MCDYLNVVNNTVNYDSGDGFKINSATCGHIVGNFLTDFFTVDDNHVDMMQFFGTSHDLLIERNKCYESTDANRIVDGIFAGIIFTQGGTDVEISNNIVYANRIDGISSYAATRVSMVNNTVFGGNASDTLPVSYVYFKEDCTECLIANNIAGRSSTGGHAGVTLLNNLDFYRDFTGAGFVYWVEDGPPLEQDLHLAAGSPAINAGTDIGAPGYDFDLTPRPYALLYDVGAFEYTGKIDIID